jgi:hypothetical protein
VTVNPEILEIINRETEAWNSQNTGLLLTLFHPDMVWFWPKKKTDHDPALWDLFPGRFEYSRWLQFYDDFFSKFKLIHNHRKLIRADLSQERDAALAVLDIDTLWYNPETGESSHWLGRVSKTYVKMQDEWKLIAHTGVLDYGNKV